MYTGPHTLVCLSEKRVFKPTITDTRCHEGQMEQYKYGFHVPLCFLHWQAGSLPLSYLRSPILGVSESKKCHQYSWGFPAGSHGKARDPGSIPGSGRSPGEGSGSPLQYSCLENPMDRGDWWATIHSVAESDTIE